MPNIYEFFIHKGLKLIRTKGRFGFIVPDRFGSNNQFVRLREMIIADYTVDNLLYKVPFPGVVVDTMVYIFSKEAPTTRTMTKIENFGEESQLIFQSDLAQSPSYIFNTYLNPDVDKLISKISIRSNTTLKNICKTTSGFGGKSILITNVQKDNSQIPVLKGESIKRYRTKKVFYFLFLKKNITGRTTDPIKLGKRPKILLRKTGNALIATYDETGYFPEQSLYFIYDLQENISYLYLLGLLNSKLINFYYQTKLLTNRESIAQVKKVDLDSLPVLVTDDPTIIRDVEILVRRLLELGSKEGTLPSQKELLISQIRATEATLDSLIYVLFQLTPTEIQIIEA